MRIALTAIALLAGCTAIVDAPDDRIRCAIGEAGDPCPGGQRCFEGFCAEIPCMENETGCNGIDDDCDGETDEGSDVDDDGFSWCATDPMLRDCRDDNRMIHPGSPEIEAPEDVPCDGADNDCNGSTTECGVGTLCHPSGGCRPPDCSFAFRCPSGQRCNTALEPAECETATVDCTVTPCTVAGEICDPISLQCAPPRAFGEPCEVDEQCMAGAICVETSALAISSADVGNASKVCSQTCCQDSDCGVDNVCWAPGTGARGCLPRAFLDRGSGAPTEPSCASTAECAEECVYTADPAYNQASRSAYICGAPVGENMYSCTVSSDCLSGLCIEYCSFLGCFTECSIACGASDDCRTQERCGWLQLDQDGFLQTCLLAGFGDGAAGSSCDGDDDCRDDACVNGPSGSTCADACCSDEDCGSRRCRPTRIHGRWEMLCIEAS